MDIKTRGRFDAPGWKLLRAQFDKRFIRQIVVLREEQQQLLPQLFVALVLILIKILIEYLSID
jgi:hypothetical protein